MSHPSLPFGPFQFTGALLSERFAPSSSTGQSYAYAPGDAPRAVRSARPLNRPFMAPTPHVAGASPASADVELPFAPPRLTWPIVAPIVTPQTPKQQVAGAWTDWIPPYSGIGLFKDAVSDDAAPAAPSGPMPGGSVAEGAESKASGKESGKTSWLVWLAGGVAVAVAAGVAISYSKK